MKGLVTKLVWANLTHRPLVSLLTVATLAAAVALMSLILQFSGHTETRLKKDLADVDLVVGAKGSPLQLILSSLLHVDVPTGNIPLREAQALMRDPQISAAVPLALGDSFRGFRIVGTTPEFLDFYGADVEYGLPWTRAQDVVIGSLVHKTLAMQVGQQFVGAHGLSTSGQDLTEHAHAPYRVVGILAPTGSIVDRLIITPVESVWAAHEPGHEDHADEHEEHDDLEGHEDHDEPEEHRRHDDHDTHRQEHDEHDKHGDEGDHRDQHQDGHDEGATRHHGDHADHSDSLAIPLVDFRTMDPGDREITALLVRFATPIAAYRLPRVINAKPGLQAAAPAIEVTRLFSLSSGLTSAAKTVAALLALVGALSIFAAISSATAAGMYDVALMRAMGAKPSFIFLERILEGTLLAAASAAVGILFAHLSLLVAYQSYDSLMIFGLHGGTFFQTELYLAGGTILIGALAALWPAISCYRVDPSLLLQRGR